MIYRQVINHADPFVAVFHPKQLLVYVCLWFRGAAY